MLTDEIKDKILKTIFGVEPKTLCEVLDLDIATEDEITEFLADTHELVLITKAIRENERETGISAGGSRWGLPRGDPV